MGQRSDLSQVFMVEYSLPCILVLDSNYWSLVIIVFLTKARQIMTVSQVITEIAKLHGVLSAAFDAGEIDMELAEDLEAEASDLANSAQYYIYKLRGGE